MVVRRLRKDIETKSVNRDGSSAYGDFWFPSFLLQPRNRRQFPNRIFRRRLRQRRQRKGHHRTEAPQKVYRQKLHRQNRRRTPLRHRSPAQNSTRQKSVSRQRSASDTQSMTEWEDSIESEQKQRNRLRLKRRPRRRQRSLRRKRRQRKGLIKGGSGSGTIIFENDFNEIEADTELAKGKVKQLAEGNMAVEYNADFTKGWEQPLNADSFQLDAEYTAGIKRKQQ